MNNCNIYNGNTTKGMIAWVEFFSSTLAQGTLAFLPLFLKTMLGYIGLLPIQALTQETTRDVTIHFIIKCEISHCLCVHKDTTQCWLSHYVKTTYILHLVVQLMLHLSITANSLYFCCSYILKQTHRWYEYGPGQVAVIPLLYSPYNSIGWA